MLWIFLKFLSTLPQNIDALEITSKGDFYLLIIMKLPTYAAPTLLILKAGLAAGYFAMSLVDGSWPLGLKVVTVMACSFFVQERARCLQ